MNKLHAIAAATALVAFGSAHALTPAQIDAARGNGSLKEVSVSGASALRLSFAAYASEILDNLHRYQNDASGNNHRAYAGTLNQAVGSWGAGTPVILYKRDQGGSGQGVNPVAAATPIAHMVVNAATCTAGDGSVASPYLCGTTENRVSDAGISDLEPALLQKPANLPSGAAALNANQLGNLDVAPLVQGIFGVAVNKKAYRALQQAQGIIPVGAPLLDVPADQNTWNAATLATIPSLPVEFVRAALSGSLGGGAGNATTKRGWNIVIPTSVDPNVVTKTINIVRRVEGSGTQAASNVFFLNNGSSETGALAPLGVAGSTGNPSVVHRVTGPGYVVQEGSGAGNVEDGLGRVSAADTVNSVEEAADGDGIAYGLGVLGREVNPLRDGGDRGYRFVKLDGVAPVRALAKAGDYGFVFEATMQWNKTVVPAGSEKSLFLTALRSNLGKPSSLAAVDSNTQQGVMSPPSTYTGAYVDATGDAALFGSRVARQANNSASPLRIIK